MITRDVRKLLARANPHLTECLEGAVGFTLSRQHPQVTLEHLMLKLIEKGDGDLPPILRHFGVDLGRLEARLLHAVDRFRTGHDGRPSFSPRLLDLLEKAFLVGQLEFGEEMLRSGAILAAGLEGEQALLEYLDLLEGVHPEDLRRHFEDLVRNSAESRPATGRFGSTRSANATEGESGAPRGDGALDQFTLDFTASARNGDIDPVYGRDDEIRQMIDILSRRRKNNPILVGEAGVGKTALVEGLALRIASGDVPHVLAGVEIRSLDLGLLQAGAGVKGEFENRLKSVIAEIRESPVPIITFIDEAHTLIGAGGSAGQGDAANLLKPALARGELRTIAATTWSEYKKYFEKDAALARRFQLVKVDEPDEKRALVMMRGIKGKFEESHKVRILDTAVIAAVQLAERFIAGRQLPDKSVDLLDTAAARVKIALSSKPAPVEDLERTIENATIALEAKKRDRAEGVGEDHGDIERLEKEIATAGERLDALRERWEKEKAAVEQVFAARGIELDEPTETSAEEAPDEESKTPETQVENEEATPKLQDAEAELSDEEREAQIIEALAELHNVQGSDPLIPLEVTPDVISSIVSDWTGIPAGKMQRDQARSILDLEPHLNERVLGQDPALTAIAQRLRASHAGLGDPNQPQGVFLLVGPSGIGKTETALALADLIYGGERFMTTINMSEYMESHTVSRLIGSPPGYVGFGEGGVLTEAVRQRPYSVVLLDEVEKSHPDVMNLFYQVFDKGTMADGEGREIDFRNTVLVMTSNLGSDTLMEMCADIEPTTDELIEAIRPTLRERFKPALLGRMTVIPYLPLPPDVMRRIVDLKLGKIIRRLQGNARVALTYDEAVAEWITERCTVEESGARNIDQIIQAEVLPDVSTAILERMSEGEMPDTIHLAMGSEGRPVYEMQ